MQQAKCTTLEALKAVSSTVVTNCGCDQDDKAEDLSEIEKALQALDDMFPAEDKALDAMIHRCGHQYDR